MNNSLVELPVAGKGVTWAVVLSASVAAAVLLTAPLLVGEMVIKTGFTEAQAGYIISAELGGMAFATLPAFLWLGRVAVSRVLTVVLGLFIIGNLATFAYTLGEPQFNVLFFIRFLVAIAGGSVMVLCMTSIRLFRMPERLFALWVLGQLIFGVVWISLLPSILSAFGLSAFYIIVATLMLGVAPLAKHFPSCLTAPRPEVGAGESVGWLLPVLCLSGVLLFYVSLGGIWAFVERIAAASDLPGSTIGSVLSVATVFGVLGALAATWVGANLRQLYTPVGVALAALCISVVLLRGTQTAMLFLIATAIFKFCWSFALPFLLGCVARIDYSGRLVTSINLIIGGGTAIGPAVAGYTLAATDSYSQMVTVFILSSASSLVLMTYVAFRVSLRLRAFS